MCEYSRALQEMQLTTHNDITNHVVMNKNYMRAIPAEWRNISQVFTALGDEHRQRILLTFEPGERLNVGQIVEVSTLSRSAVSHHLKVLKDAGVLDSEKEGKEVYFWLDKAFLVDALATVTQYIKQKA
jgi:ArsR family transcriptional regulator, arsenate/arsenite/antimonite-responsive transcriptional repressor